MSRVCAPEAREAGRLISGFYNGEHSHQMENSFSKELGDQEEEQLSTKGMGRVKHSLNAYCVPGTVVNPLYI